MLETNSGRTAALRTARWLLALMVSAAAQQVMAQDAIYRCEARSGALIFQDQPCSDATGTRESRSSIGSSGGAGIRMHLAPPPAEDGAVAQERYRRYLDQVDKERREQAAADNAAASRARAEADAAAARAPVPRSDRPDICQDAVVAETDSRCQGGGARSFAVIYPVYVPVQAAQPIKPNTGRQPPGRGDKATRLPPRTPKDPRAEILDNRR